MILSVSRESFEESTSHLFHLSHLLQSLTYLASQTLMMMMIRVVTVSLRSSHKDRQLSGRRHFMTTDRGLPD
jgi:hypothetical protein